MGKVHRDKVGQIGEDGWVRNGCGKDRVVCMNRVLVRWWKYG